MKLSEKDWGRLKDSYPQEPVMFDHGLESIDLLKRQRIAQLAKELPITSVEQNKGDLPVAVDPTKAEGTGLSPEETVLSIEDNGAWIVLKNIEQSPEYAALLDEILDQVDKVASGNAGVDRNRREGFIFVSSPNSITPFHIDPEHNILFQIEGSKMMTVYPIEEPFITDEELEAFHTGAHRNLKARDGIVEGGTRFDLTSGKALHVPVTAPHWVQNGNGVSVSLSVTWRSKYSRQEHDRHRLNAWRRKKGQDILDGYSPLQTRMHAAMLKAGFR